MNEYQENEDFESSDNDSVNTPISDKGDGELVLNELSVYHYDVRHEFSEEYFIGYQISALLGYKNPAEVIKKNVSKCNQLIFRDLPEESKKPEIDPRTILITRDGAIEILLKTRKRISPDVHHILKRFGIDTTNHKCLSKEQQTLSIITNTFKTEKFEDQFKVGRYYLDLYFPEYKIVVECDENGHADRKPDDERKRMDYVNEKLGLTDDNWVRFNPDEKNFDISKVTGKIYTRINLLKSVQIETLLQNHVSLPAPPIEDESEEDESNDEEAIKELNDKNNFKQIREICKELEIIQLGNKMDMIKRIVKYNKDLKKETETIERYLEERKHSEDEENGIYQYNDEGVFVNKFRTIEEAAKRTKTSEEDLKNVLESKAYKANNFIWRNEKTIFSKEELKTINRKNVVIILKMDMEGNIVKTYNTIQEAANDSNLSRNIIDRLTMNGEYRDGFRYVLPNKDNKIKHMSQKEKDEIIRKNKEGKTTAELAKEYNKNVATVRRLIFSHKKKEKEKI
jgi:very-short-patch-repair endonuclease/Mor family transcriptional regulator